jgi:hypothetical protein
VLSARHEIAAGHITVVQEQRFRLVTDTGQGLLLTLAHNAPVGENDLQRWHQAKTHVAVTYEGQPNFASGIAYAVKPTVEDISRDDVGV